MIKISLFSYRADLSQQRIFVYFNSPALILGKVKMQKIKFMQRCLSYERFNLVNGVKLSSDIKHKASDFTSRLILDYKISHIFALLKQNFLERLQGKNSASEAA